VDYDFRNDSNEAISTEVAFPIPSYKFPTESDTSIPNQQGFDDFRLWVNTEPTTFVTEVRAFVGLREITELLRRLNVDAASFGHFGNGGKPFGQLPYFSRDIERLSVVQRRQLIQAKAITGENDRDSAWEAEWRVEKKYHWTQTFPAHAVVHIRHEYTPVLGNSNTIGDPAHYDPRDPNLEEFASLCPSASLLQALTKMGNSDEHPVGLAYVDFIVTTANTWKTPIEDFTLIVERPATSRSKANFVSFCWDGPVTKLDDRHFSAHLTNFVPKKELRVGFIQ